MKNLILTSALSLISCAAFAQQNTFVLKGTVDPVITDSCYNVYIADEYGHYEKSKPDFCIPVVDKKFSHTFEVDKVTAAYVKCIFPGGEECSASIAFMMVPNSEYTINVHNGYYGDDYDYNYRSRLERGIYALREKTQWKSPYLPKVKGKVWKNPEYDNSSSPMYVKEVFFTDTATIVHFVQDYFLSSMTMSKDAYLTDENGKEYKIKNALFGNLGGANNGGEARFYGTYYSFEPLPKGTKSFDIMHGNGEINNVCESKTVKGKPNFEVEVNITNGISDSGYLISRYDKNWSRPTQIADIAAKDRKANYQMILDEPCLADLTATFPDGSVCTHCIRMVFVPGDKAVVSVENGTNHITGTGFYKQWSDTEEFIRNSRNYVTKAESDAKIMSYLKDHANEEGTVVYFLIEQEYPYSDIIQLVPEEMQKGRFKGLFKQSEEREAIRKYEEEREAQQLKLQEPTSEGKMFTDFEVEYDGKIQKLSDYVGKGKYVLVDFWASWCGPCMGEIPNLINIWNEFKGDNFEVLGVATWDKPEDSKQAIENKGIPYPQILNAQKIGSDAYGIMGIPQIILFGPDGTILKRNLRGSAIKAEVMKYLSL